MSSELQKAVEALVKQEPGWKPFTKAPTKGGKPGGVTTGYPSSSKAGEGGLKEADYTKRKYWPASEVTNLATSDGLFTVSPEPIREILLTTGKTFEFAQPVATP